MKNVIIIGKAKVLPRRCTQQGLVVIIKQRKTAYIFVTGHTGKYIHGACMSNEWSTPIHILNITISCVAQSILMSARK